MDTASAQTKVQTTTLWGDAYMELGWPERQSLLHHGHYSSMDFTTYPAERHLNGA